MPDRAAIIAAEQRAVDHAYECYERPLRENRAQRARRDERTDAHAGTAFIPTLPPELRTEDALAGASLVMHRIDALDEGRVRTCYIGRASVFDDEHDLVVANWQTRQATRWLLARPEDPGEVMLRRDLTCKGPKVRGYRDVLVRPLRNGVPAATAPPPTRDTVRELRDLLLDELGRARDGRMRDIVETIQREQLALVADERAGLLVVQGGPGTGKTAVGLHRVSWLLFNKLFKPGEVLVVGPHRGFLEHVRGVLPQLGTHDVRMVALDLLWERPGAGTAADAARTGRRTAVDGAKGTDAPAARAVKADLRMAAVLRNALDAQSGRGVLARRAAHGGFVAAFEGTHLSASLDELKALADAHRDAPTYEARRARFADALVELLVERYGLQHQGRQDRTLPERIARHAHVTRLVGRLWPKLTAERVLRDLLTDPVLLHKAAQGILDGAEQAAILRGRAARLEQEPWTLADLVCLEELRVLISGEGPRRYPHLVVDEAQDLTPMQARSLARRCPTGSMTVLGDLAQATGPHRYAGWDELAALLGPGAERHLAELDVGYRVPQQVMEFAEPLARRLAPGTAFPRSVRPVDGALSLVPVDGAEVDAAALDAARAVRAAADGADRSVALIVPDRRRSALRTGAPAGVHVLTAAQAKGLEFDHVVLAEPAEIAAQEPAGAGGLYVALTRCTQSLTVVHGAPIPVGPDEDGERTERSQEEDMTDTSTDRPGTGGAAGAPAEGFDRFVAALEGSVRDERRCNIHEHLRHRLLSDLFSAGLAPTSTPVVDAVCDGPAGTVLYEVLGEDRRAYLDLREAVLRLMEAAHAEGETADHRFVVLPGEPVEDWAAETLDEAFGVNVLWLEDGHWRGNRVPLALGRAAPGDRR
ncbi:HelD family protein [Actinomadura parmotrematis]|uniref:AAA family ATPase n=1 Tax=Actinomadura parmotrematis TaxID=2864039 RepID=A0ABS7FYL2_9ACTN|nr:ATP-binding domain-containing protein [Actinomadura parmotrematis]MBW8485525.1 AAA family ATPase [Actinomadura parmotrematis]